MHDLVQRAAILEAFAASPSRLPFPFSRMTASELTPPRFPPDWLETTVDPGGFLDAYKRLPPASRARDLLIQDPIGDAYWLSEYTCRCGTGSIPLRLHSAFRRPRGGITIFASSSRR